MNALPQSLPSLEAIRAERARRALAADRERLDRDAEVIRTRCRESFPAFVKEAWHVIEPGTPLRWSWHLDAMCLHLQAITEGRLTPWLIINVPPGSSKSTIVSVLWQAWEWGPRGLRHLRYVSTSFEEENVKRDTRKTRDLIQSPWFARLWPEVLNENGRLNRAGETSFANRDTGSREGVAFASVTGKRGDRVLIDDPHSLKGAESETQRNETVRLFMEGGLNRTNDALTSAMVIVMQRLHENDLTGAILARQLGFVHLMIPMEFDPGRRCETPIGWSDPRTFDGELMDPARFPEEAVERQKKAGVYAWAGQYQQRPTPREGGLFKPHWFEPIKALPADVMRTVRAWDLAATAKTATNNPDWTAGVRMSRTRGGLFIIEGVSRFQGGPMAVEQAVTQQAPIDGTKVVICLDQDPGAAGKADAQTKVRKLAGYTVKVERPTGDKATRASPLAAQAEAGNVRILVTGDPARDAWVQPFLDEVCVFPAGMNDDQVDAAARAFNELALGGPRYNIAALT